jgi:hypothetical protein
MSAIKGAFTLAAAAMLLYTGIRAIDKIEVSRHNKRIMEAEKVLTPILEQQFANLSPERREKFMNMEGVETVIEQFMQGSRTAESLTHMLTFYRTNFA